MTKRSEKRPETPEEKTSYRWMMRTLREVDKAVRRGKHSITVIVHHVGELHCSPDYATFVRNNKPVAKHAIAMMSNGGIRAGCTFRKAGTRNDLDLDPAYPRSHKIIFVVQV